MPEVVLIVEAQLFEARTRHIGQLQFLHGIRQPCAQDKTLDLEKTVRSVQQRFVVVPNNDVLTMPVLD